jgi:hypothetical protein
MRALPLDQTMKMVYWKRYLKMRQHNGRIFASEVFKNFRQVLMGYINDIDRCKNREGWMRQCDQIRLDGWLQKLFNYADTDPISVLQFLKLYTTEAEPVVTTDESAEAQEKVLSTALPTGLPWEIFGWVWMVTLPATIWRKSYRMHQRYPGMTSRGYHMRFHGSTYFFPAPSVPQEDPLWDKWRIYLNRVVYPLMKSEEEVERLVEYCRRWQRILRAPEMDEDKLLQRYVDSLPTPASYSDTQYGAYRPEDGPEGNLFLFEEDLMAFGAMANSNESFYPFLDMLPEEYVDFLGYVNDAEEGQLIVGHVNHIPKKGTVKRRPIAAPNRMLQSCLLPMKEYLDRIVRRIPRNCQYDQARLDHVIRDAVNNGYAGSVDLSQATDWLPYDWFIFMAKEFGWFETGIPALSYDIYNWSLDQLWDNSGEHFVSEVQWKRGQPLGTWPSFDILTITQTVAAEACAFRSMQMDSPYAVLGDDIVFFEPRSRFRYITLMERAGSPLSLHKSYDGRLSEFAGKIYIQNQPTRFTPDIGPLSMRNLFDYQVVAGVNIKWSQLPKATRRKICELCSVNCSSKFNPKTLYQTAQVLVGVPGVKISKEIDELIISYFSCDWDEGEPDRIYDSGFFPFDGSVLRWTDQPVWRYKLLLPKALMRRKTQEWYKAKVRPVDADFLLERLATL